MINKNRTGRHIRNTLLIAAIALLSFSGVLQAQSENKRNRALSSITQNECKEHIYELGDEKYKGRPSGTKYCHKAAKYIAKDFRKAGLKPIPGSGSNSGGNTGSENNQNLDGYFQKFDHQKTPGSKKFWNVIGWAEGTHEKLKNTYVVIGAHYDHLGKGNFGSRGQQGQIHNGADDNASGTGALLEFGEALQKVDTRRSVVLIAFSAEERGLIGSKYYGRNPVFPMDKTVTMLNMDMISRGKIRKIKVGGKKTSEDLTKLLKNLSNEYKIEISFQGMSQYSDRGDHAPFIKRDVPALFFFGGMHSDYHKHTDDPGKTKPKKAMAISRLVFFVAYKVAMRKNPPK